DRIVAQINGIEARLAREVESSYRSIVALSQQSIADTDDRARQSKTLFWDTEKLAAELSRGAADMLDYKRRLLENANFVYNLYRNRYNILAQFAGETTPIEEDFAFISSAAGLERMQSK